MGGGTDDQDHKDGTKGFAGLSSLVSDVDATVSDAGRHAEAPPHAAGREATRTAASPTSSPSPEPSPAYQPPPQPSGGGSTGKWIAGIAVVVGLIWLVSLSDKRTPSTSPTYTPAAESQSAPSTTPAWQPPSPAVQQSNRPTEEQPPVGNGLSLSMPQLRYCTAENIRLDAAKAVINSYSDTDIDRFKALVADYNSRCGQFRYRRGSLESARSEVEQHRSEIEAEGRARFSRTSAPATLADQPREVPVAKPDFTVQAIQRRLNKFGYDAGEEDGFVGEQTRAAISAFQRDENIAVDGRPSLDLLKRLSEHVAPAQNSTAPKSPTPVPAQPPARSATQDAPKQSGIPANAELDYTGKAWTCKRGFRQVGADCELVEMPPNAELDYTGKAWTCKRGFKQNGTSCERVGLPANAELDYTGKAWTCKRGFKQVGVDCEPVEMPANAELDYTGKAWTCKRGFKQIGASCERVEMPANAELDYTGKAWTCKRGFKQVGTDCERVEMPTNAELDYTGKAWTCKRGFRQVGTGCERVELPANAELDYTGKAWTCKRGFRQVGAECSPI